MSFRNGESFSNTYPSTAAATRALKSANNRGLELSPQGTRAKEMFELIGIATVTTFGCAAIGARVGAFFGPEGVPIGAAGGALVGLGASYFILDWYVSATLHRDGSVTIAYTPA